MIIIKTNRCQRYIPLYLKSRDKSRRPLGGVKWELSIQVRDWVIVYAHFDSINSVEKVFK
ncbi:hypothetical protein VC82_2526 [Flagellimonas lutaonensis]|uniref:Uncharacterized protein n=1 Tax=Flagellimonas lutaonensis TaxID=516051 RepID=A0A0D5YW14_9FLAO|nr:hypothetical protein VC82_2526 [Allomuricauda lutaonensis]